MKTPLPSAAAAASLAGALLQSDCLSIALGCAAFLVGAQPARAAVTEAWVQRYGSDEQPQTTKVVCDALGNIIVASEIYSTNNSTSTDMLTTKYSGSDGSVLWQKRYNGPNTKGNSWEYPTGLALDGSGNAVVTGPSFNAIWDYGYDYYTAKYAAADGALLWEKRYNGGTVVGGSDDVPHAVAVDSNGNVVVTGESSVNPAPGVYSTVFYTAKYAAADGALLWEKRYNGPANRDDLFSSLALGPNGMVVIAGSSLGGSSTDITTVVYRENLPAVLIAMVPEGIHIHFTGVPGSSYNIERATAATGPWSTIATPTAPLDGLIEYTDTNPPPGTAFYRTSTP